MQKPTTYGKSLEKLAVGICILLSLSFISGNPVRYSKECKMSQENAKKLLAQVTNDQALAQKLRTAGKNGFDQFAKAQGLECSFEEFTEAAKLSAASRLHEQLGKTKADAIVGVGSIGVI
jgi:predicted ribosomally synthesized peptide with nif11-like leader